MARGFCGSSCDWSVQSIATGDVVVVVVAAAARRCLMGLICCAHTSGGRRWRVFQKNKKTTFWVWPELKINSVPNNIVADLCFGPTLHSTTVHTIPYTQ